MLKVYKYEVPIQDQFVLSLPVGAEILAFQAQYDHPVIWALVDPDDTVTEQRRFRLAGTGHPIEETGAYVGTCQLRMGNLVLHLFEVV